MIYFWSDIFYIIFCILICKQLHTILKKEVIQKTERRIGYIALLVIASWCMQLYPATIFLFCIMACALIGIFITPHHTIQSNSTNTNHTSLYGSKNWTSLLIRNIVSIQQKAIQDLHFCIGPETLLIDQLYTPCPMRMPLSKNSLLCILSSAILDTQKHIMISREGTILGINTAWYNSTFNQSPLLATQQKEWAQEYNFLFVDSLNFGQTFTITHQSKIHKNINAAQAAALLEQYIEQKTNTFQKKYEKHTQSFIHNQP